ncbi:hypothetical protein [Devosia sp. RR2S18]|uniref:hypothetical protein n=1 Tax=Devosia rhizosphaerae TaxID=3049774 RepID=UPI002540F124|nr:hypothetical protein [Devosia sp. RR2S18]WIJ26961.1 hypothetical protein QOV41_09530 [Devosia sp. RR2S18]
MAEEPSAAARPTSLKSCASAESRTINFIPADVVELGQHAGQSYDSGELLTRLAHEPPVLPRLLKRHEAGNRFVDMIAALAGIRDLLNGCSETGD